MNRTSHWARFWATACLMAFGAIAGAQQQVSPQAQSQPAQVALGSVYCDDLNGFSLRPPDNCQRSREPSRSMLVSWNRRDAKTGAILLTMSVVRMVEKSKDIDLREYAKALGDKLRKDEGYKIDSTDIVSAAGCGAIDFRGAAGGLVSWWQRQTWVLTPNGKFIILITAGPQDVKGRLDAIHQDVLATLKITDPAANLAARQASLERAKRLLAALTEKSLTAAAVDNQWFLVYQKDQPIGWVHQNEGVVLHDGTMELRVRTVGMVKPAKDSPAVIKHAEMFASPDGLLESWKERLAIGEGKELKTAEEEGLRQENVLLCVITSDGKKQDRPPLKIPHPAVDQDANSQRPAAISEIYLPRATGMVLPRLVALGESASYGFATYSSDVNDFDLRTFTVVGPDAVSLGGQSIEAIHLTDKPSASTEPSDLWVDAKGRVLMVRSPDGLRVEKASNEDVLKVFPSAQQIADEPEK